MKLRRWIAAATAGAATLAGVGLASADASVGAGELTGVLHEKGTALQQSIGNLAIEPDELPSANGRDEPFAVAASPESTFAEWTLQYAPGAPAEKRRAVFPRYVQTPSCEALAPSAAAHECVCYQPKQSRLQRLRRRGEFCAFDESTGACAAASRANGSWTRYDPERHYRLCRDFVWLPHLSHVAGLYSAAGASASENATAAPSLYNRAVMSVFQNGVAPVHKMRQLTVPPHQLFTSGTPMSSFVGHTHDIIRVVQTLIKQAQEEIVLADCYLEPNSLSVAMVREALVDLNARRAREAAGQLASQSNRIPVFIMVKGRDLLPRVRHHVADARLASYGLPTPAQVPFLDLRLQLVHHFPVGILHSKLMVVDRLAGLVLSANIEDHWFTEFAVHMQGPVVDGLQSHFWSTWGDARIVAPALPVNSLGRQLVRAGGYDSLRFHRAMLSANWTRLLSNESIVVHHHPANATAPMRPVRMALVSHAPDANYFRFDPVNPQDAAFLAAAALARKRIVIRTPNLNSRRMVRALLAAAHRNVTVDVTMSLGINNFVESMPLQGGTNVAVARKLYAKVDPALAPNLRVCWHVGQLANVPVEGDVSHIKFLAVDDEISIFGSGNQDSQSWYHSQEVNLMVDSPPLAQLWSRMMELQANPRRRCYPDNLMAVAGRHDRILALSFRGTTVHPSMTRHVSEVLDNLDG